MHLPIHIRACTNTSLAMLVLLLACVSAADVPGRFDYYVLSLSWSPQYWAQARGHEPQCARPYAFVVHGLWPQYERGYPSDCRADARVEEATIERMLPIMPSRSLVIHEWRTHGTCAGSAPRAYFANVERAYRSIRVPSEYSVLESYLTQNREQVRRAFSDANPNLPANAIRLQCSGRYLKEVQVCLTRDGLSPRACGTDMRDRCGAMVVFRPVR